MLRYLRLNARQPLRRRQDFVATRRVRGFSRTARERFKHRHATNAINNDPTAAMAFQFWNWRDGRCMGSVAHALPRSLKFSENPMLNFCEPVDICDLARDSPLTNAP